MDVQREKQARFNAIDTCVVLYMNQVECLQDGKLADDLSDAIVFSSKELERLKRRALVRGAAPAGGGAWGFVRGHLPVLALLPCSLLQWLPSVTPEYHSSRGGGFWAKVQRSTWDMQNVALDKPHLTWL